MREREKGYERKKQNQGKEQKHYRKKKSWKEKEKREKMNSESDLISCDRNDVMNFSMWDECDVSWIEAKSGVEKVLANGIEWKRKEAKKCEVKKKTERWQKEQLTTEVSFPRNAIEAAEHLTRSSLEITMRQEKKAKHQECIPEKRHWENR